MRIYSRDNNSFITFKVLSSLKNSIILLATISPTSWTDTNSSKVAFSRFSKDSNLFTKSLAVLTPTLGIPKEYKNASKVQSLLFLWHLKDFVLSLAQTYLNLIIFHILIYKDLIYLLYQAFQIIALLFFLKNQLYS